MAEFGFTLVNARQRLADNTIRVGDLESSEAEGGKEKK
jgi:hypothetical protein